MKKTLKMELSGAQKGNGGLPWEKGSGHYKIEAMSSKVGLTPGEKTTK